MPNQTLDISV